MRLADRLLLGGQTPLLMLDALQFGRTVFEPAEARWFDPLPLLGIARQARQALRHDVLVLPLLTWLQAAFPAHRGAAQQGARPDRVLRTRLEQPDVLAALRESVAALSGAGAALALGIDGPLSWLAWAGAPPTERSPLDEAEAEDVAVYLAALVQKLPAESITALVLHDADAIDGSAEIACEPLLNAGRHLAWASVQCGVAGERRLAGFDAFASPGPEAGDGWHAPPAFWCGDAPAPPGVPFLCSRIPPETPVQQVLAALSALRA